MSENRLYQTIASEIRKLIDRGEFPPGSRLPGERDLAERFGVSRVTVREAEIALEAQGLISIRIGSGVYVKARPAQIPGGLPDVTAFDLTAARAVIEAEAAAMAASRVTDADLRELEALVVALSSPDASTEAVSEADRQFHLAIARIAGNPVVEHCVQLIWRIRGEVPRVREVHAKVCHDDGDTRREEHMAIFDALRRRDPAGARTAMRNHFKRLFEAMLEATESQALEEIRRRTQADRERFIAATSI
ncbi:FadR/GntR family transcriptional regulator [Xanthomonas sp. XNM01]|jgi:DNA-binding FadR family transcriptional regulator|uniref:FadR/GntR family transcriptional regulator n=1 Tax=Xanthomonas sp. XNM01 TaxID=2769289 RepID=UPI00177FBFE9|nr:FadR/GntR family transcriptional regulator [Xanthomonas sp. XNM01]MBD9368483.1 FadR family transcriptional regulator [Xanthomonas sp. XNM01]